MADVTAQMSLRYGYFAFGASLEASILGLIAWLAIHPLHAT